LNALAKTKMENSFHLWALLILVDCKSRKEKNKYFNSFLRTCV
jgi:hypothetical protein